MLSNISHMAPTEGTAAGLARQWALLRRAPGELRLLYLLNFLNAYKYFTKALVVPLIATAEYGLSDVEAGALYGVSMLVPLPAHTLAFARQQSKGLGSCAARRHSRGHASFSLARIS